MPVNNNIRPKDDLGSFTSYEQKYSSLKTRLKVILFENELLQDELRKAQRELLDIYRDKEALLEKVLQIEDIGSSSSDSESLSSDNECDPKLIENELQVILESTINSNNKPQPKSNPSKSAPAAKRNNQTKPVTTGGSKPKANAATTKKAAASSNSKPGTNGVVKAEKKPSVKVEGKKGSTKADPVTRPKAAGRARNKLTSNQNGIKVAPVTFKTDQPTTSAPTVIAQTMNSLSSMTPISMSQPTEMQQSQPQQQHHPHQQQQQQHNNNNQEQASLHFQLQQQQKITQHALPQTHPDTSHPYQCIQQQVATYPGYHIAAGPGLIQAQTHVQVMQLHPHSHQAGHQLMTTDMISVAHQVHTQQPNIQQQQQQQIQQQQPSSREDHQIAHHQQHQHHPHLQSHPRPHQPQQTQQQSQQQPQHQHALIAEQLSAEELEQYLEARRMEQASLLLPDWESSVPSEIFSADSGIKFMAED